MDVVVVQMVILYFLHFRTKLQLTNLKSASKLTYFKNGQFHFFQHFFLPMMLQDED